MKSITFSIYVCGMNRHTVTQKIMIHAPYAMYEKTFYGNDLASKTISDIIQIVGKDAAAFLTEHGVKLSWEHVCIRTSSALIALQEDKKLDEIFTYFSTDDIQFAYFFIVGGASIHCGGYRFTVHPDEDIHRNSPHVHVYKDGKNARYSLNTLKRFPDDNILREFIRDEKKIILPYLKKNQEKLMGYWNHYMNGYTFPAEDVDGNQYYPES